MPRRILKELSFFALLGAIVVSVDVTPEAVEMLLKRGENDRDVWISNIFYT